MIIDTLLNHQLWQNCQQKQMFLSNVQPDVFGLNINLKYCI